MATSEKSIDGGLDLCRDRMDFFQPQDFRVSTCSMCLIYLYPTNPAFKQLVRNGSVSLLMLVRSNATSGVTTAPAVSSVKSGDRASEPRLGQLIRDQGRSRGLHAVEIFPDVLRETTLQPVCSLLSESQCQRWTGCCRAARTCCDQQLKSQQIQERTDNTDGPSQQTYTKGDTRPGSSSHCPMTWDGYSCVAASTAGTTAHVTCPSYISDFHIETGARATRQCQENGTWWMSPQSKMEWTDYSKCIPVDFQALETEQIVGISCHCISILLLLPALFVFMYNRPLRNQQRIRLHSCLFLTLVLSSTHSILWERLIIYDMLVTPLLQNFVHTSPGICKFLNIMSRLTKTSSFFWMFCEGLQLHWLMVKSLKPLISMLMLMLIGWGIPVLLIIIYIIVRVADTENDSCWLTTAGGVEWLIDGPTIACIALNFLFLLMILKALLSQLSAHPDEVGTIRRALRAMFILIPLFGLQQFCILYRPSTTDDGYLVYGIASALIVGLQGGVVSLIFCFCNDEVQSLLKERFQRVRRKLCPPRARRQSTISLSMNTLASRPSVSSLGGRISLVDRRLPLGLDNLAGLDDLGVVTASRERTHDSHKQFPGTDEASLQGEHRC